MNKLLFVFGIAISLIAMSCEKNVVPPRLLDGTYSVSYKVHIQPDGTEKIYMPIGSDITGMKISGWMSESKLVFTSDSLGISQLMNEGWVTNYVSLEWANNRPIRVGCHYVESADETQISWHQDNVIIKWILVKE
jgi:hypothetical protein